jgi:hypothetical protein
MRILQSGVPPYCPLRTPELLDTIKFFKLGNFSVCKYFTAKWYYYMYMYMYVIITTGIILLT